MGGIGSLPSKVLDDFLKQLSTIGGHVPPVSARANSRGKKRESEYWNKQVTWINSYHRHDPFLNNKHIMLVKIA